MKVNVEGQDISLYLNQNIDYLLKKNHISYQLLLKYMEKDESVSLVAKWVSGLEIPSLEDLVKMSLIFRVTLDELITENLKATNK